MAQIKIYGLADELNKIKGEMSEVIHSCLVEALKLPKDKKFHRFFPLEKDDFYFPPQKSERYTVIEISMFEGRSIETKKNLIRLIFEKFKNEMAFMAEDVEITIFETPSHNWGIRGLPGDELTLNYAVNV